MPWTVRLEHISFLASTARVMTSLAAHIERVVAVCEERQDVQGGEVVSHQDVLAGGSTSVARVASCRSFTCLLHTALCAGQAASWHFLPQ